MPHVSANAMDIIIMLIRVRRYSFSDMHSRQDRFVLRTTDAFFSRRCLGGFREERGSMPRLVYAGDHHVRRWCEQAVRVFVLSIFNVCGQTWRGLNIMGWRSLTHVSLTGSIILAWLARLRVNSCCYVLRLTWEGWAEITRRGKYAAKPGKIRRHSRALDAQTRPAEAVSRVIEIVFRCPCPCSWFLDLWMLIHRWRPRTRRDRGRRWLQYSVCI